MLHTLFRRRPLSALSLSLSLPFPLCGLGACGGSTTHESTACVCVCCPKYLAGAGKLGASRGTASCSSIELPFLLFVCATARQRRSQLWIEGSEVGCGIGIEAIALDRRLSMYLTERSPSSQHPNPLSCPLRYMGQTTATIDISPSSPPHLIHQLQHLQRFHRALAHEDWQRLWRKSSTPTARTASAAAGSSSRRPRTHGENPFFILFFNITVPVSLCTVQVCCCS